MLTRLRRTPFLYFLLACCLVTLGALHACATPPAGTQKKFNDYAADTLQGADATVQLARTLLAAKKISPDDAENIAKAAETAKDGVGVARTVAAKDGEASGTARLRLAADELDRLNAYLATKKGP